MDADSRVWRPPSLKVPETRYVLQGWGWGLRAALSSRWSTGSLGWKHMGSSLCHWKGEQARAGWVGMTLPQEERSRSLQAMGSGQAGARSFWSENPCKASE